MTQTSPRSVISNGVSPAFTREPWTTFLAVTTPPMGDRNVSARDGVRVRSRREISASGTSHSSSLRRAAATRSAPLSPAAPAPLRASRVCSASTSSFSAATSDGL
jgi:hypothetical protein